jgi:hypothetical protein
LKDLVVLAADRSIEAAVRGLLARPKAIGTKPIDFETLAHPRRDPGCYQGAHEFLIPLAGQFRYALVVFDMELPRFRGRVRVWDPNSLLAFP